MLVIPRSLKGLRVDWAGKAMPWPLTFSFAVCLSLLYNPKITIFYLNMNGKYGAELL